MRAKEFEAAQIDAAVREAEREFDDARFEQYRAFVESQAERADRLAAQADRLEETLGSKDARIVRRRAFAALASDLAGELALTAEREARMPDISPDENLLYGRVLDLHGQPMPGLIVRVVPKEGQSDDLLAGGTTDEAGDFAIVYPRAEVVRALAAGLEFHVSLEDGRGKHLYTSRDPVTFDGTQAEYFEFSMPVARGRPAGRHTTGGAANARATTGRATTGPSATRRTAAPKPSGGGRARRTKPPG